MENKPNIPWSRDVLKKVGARSADTASHLYLWYHEENAKRRKGLQNEIDINEIKAAAKGVKNVWYERVKNNHQLYVPVIENRSFDWEAAKNG